MVSMEIGVTGPGAELGDMSVALCGGPGQRSCVQSSSEPLHHQTDGCISANASSQENLSLALLPCSQHLLIRMWLHVDISCQGEDMNGCKLHIQTTQIRSSFWGAG